MRSSKPIRASAASNANRVSTPGFADRGQPHNQSPQARQERFHFSLDDVDTHIQNDPDFVELMSHVTPRREVGLTELQEKLNEALQKLSEAHRAVVVMHDVQGMTHADIAKAMKCSEGTVRSRLFYARQQMQGILSDYL